MASRWRRWDCGFAVDILSSIETPKDKAIKSCMLKGQRKVNFMPSEISIPKVENATEMPERINANLNRPKSVGRGRGRRVPKETLLLASQRMEERLSMPGKRILATGRVSDFDWPSLTPGAKNEIPPSPAVKSGNLEVQNRDTAKIEPCFDEMSVHLDVDSTMQQQKSELQEITSNYPVELEDYAAVSLKDLGDPQNCIILDGASHTDKHELEELVGTFGEVKSFKVYKEGKIIIRMSDELQCEWIISCLDGTELSNKNTDMSNKKCEAGKEASTNTVSVLRVSDIIENS